MKPAEVIETAKNLAVSEGWNWVEPVTISRKRKFVFFGQVYWDVKTNSGMRGTNVWIQIDDQSGEAIKKVFLPR